MYYVNFENIVRGLLKVGYLLGSLLLSETVPIKIVVPTLSFFFNLPVVVTIRYRYIIYTQGLTKHFSLRSKINSSFLVYNNTRYVVTAVVFGRKVSADVRGGYENI